MLALYVIFVIIVVLDSTWALNSPVIRTKSGPVRGKLVQLREAMQDVYEFTGIPFAEPPIGERRFRKPVPKTPWSDVFDATKLAKSCLQVGGGGGTDAYSNYTRNVVIPGTIESEDCLQLNIWVPRETIDSLNDTDRKVLSVYVFIHGGSFISGSSMWKLYNGTMMSGFDNIIVVTIQYRLGVLGFAYFGKNDDAPGNVGLWDQMEALKWISENIASFGGNNSQVTIGGESAGAASVAFHLLSPQSRRYFQRAIVESGSATARWAFHSPQTAQAMTDTILNLTKCAASVNSKSSPAEKLKCLRSIDATELEMADGIAMSMGYIDNFISIPVVDGDFVPRDPSQMLSSGDFYKVPLLMGANRDEGSLSVASNAEAVSFLGLDNYDPDCSQLEDLNYTHFVTIFNYVSSYVIPPDLDADGVLSTAIQLHYWPSVPDSFPKGRQIFDAIIQATGDYALTCPTFNWAKTASPYLKAVNNAQVYVYRFTQQPPDLYHGAGWMGATHGAELPYLFGEPFLEYTKPYYSYDDKLLSIIMMEYWGNFIKYGDPNVRDEFLRCDSLQMSRRCRLVNWPPYIGDADCTSRIIELNYMKQAYQIGEAVSCGLKARDCSFWSDLFPKLIDLVAMKNRMTKQASP